MTAKALRWMVAGLVIILIGTTLALVVQQQRIDDAKKKAEHVCALALANQVALHFVIDELEAQPTLTPEAKARLSAQDQRVSEVAAQLASCS